MRIKKIKWNDHPILGNLELDFINPITGEPSDNIIFAGENGTGKTTILETMSTVLNHRTFEYFDFIEFQIGHNNFKILQSTINNNSKNYFDVYRNGEVIEKNVHMLSVVQTDDLKRLGCIYSKARANYKTEKITVVRSIQLDTNHYDIDRDDEFTSLKQLVVDIENQDASDYKQLNEGLGANPKSVSEFYQLSKIYRFKNAFDNFFDKVKYKGVIDRNNEKAILFIKNSKDISIDDLSTGEKQIVFRGSYLLRNIKMLEGALIMIDEPELSMHPKWQKKILKYYKDLFTESGQQKAQIFFATHSSYVLEDALLNPNTNLVIVLNDVGGNISAKKIDAPSVLPTITSAETNYLAFDIVPNDYLMQLYGWLQDKESVGSVKSCDDFIKNSSHYVSAIHKKPSSFNNTNYETLVTYIRNANSHSDPINKTYTESELRTSIELLIELVR